jgi:cobalt-precorrin 5A hydrolase
MRVAGIGFRAGASHAALLEALVKAGGPDGLTALATAADKATALQSFAATLCLPVLAVDAVGLANQPVLTHSTRVKTLYGTGSLAEAAALAAAGPGARLLGSRVQSSDGMATAAIAERITP